MELKAGKYARSDRKLEGLMLAEVTFDSEAELEEYPIPDFAVREVSGDVRYTGGALAAKE